MTTKATHQLFPLSKTRPVETENPAVRTQLALVRSITDELRRLPPDGPLARALEAQLNEEMSRLDRLSEELPRSGAHSIKLQTG